MLACKRARISSTPLSPKGMKTPLLAFRAKPLACFHLHSAARSTGNVARMRCRTTAKSSAKAKGRALANVRCHMSKRMRGLSDTAKSDPLTGHPCRIPRLTSSVTTGQAFTSNVVRLSADIARMMLRISAETSMAARTLNIQVWARLGSEIDEDADGIAPSM